jgi:hypothetical protein
MRRAPLTRLSWVLVLWSVVVVGGLRAAPAVAQRILIDKPVRAGERRCSRI